MAEIVIEFALIGAAVLLLPVGLALAFFGLRHRRSKRATIGIGCLLLIGVLWWGTNHAEFWIVDRCLDAGGRYDHQARSCEFE